MMWLATPNCSRLIAEKDPIIDAQSIVNVFVSGIYEWRKGANFVFRSLVYTDIHIVNFQLRPKQMKKFLKSHHKSTFDIKKWYLRDKSVFVVLL